MPRLRNAVTVVSVGLALSVLGAGTAAATDCPPPPSSECPSMGCAGGLGIGGVLGLGGLLNGLLGGLDGLGGGACCPDD